MTEEAQKWWLQPTRMSCAFAIAAMLCFASFEIVAAEEIIMSREYSTQSLDQGDSLNLARQGRELQSNCENVKPGNDPHFVYAELSLPAPGLSSLDPVGAVTAIEDAVGGAAMQACVDAELVIGGPFVLKGVETVFLLVRLDSPLTNASQHLFEGIAQAGISDAVVRMQYGSGLMPDCAMETMFVDVDTGVCTTMPGQLVQNIDDAIGGSMSSGASGPTFGQNATAWLLAEFSIVPGINLTSNEVYDFVQEISVEFSPEWPTVETMGPVSTGEDEAVFLLLLRLENYKRWTEAPEMSAAEENDLTEWLDEVIQRTTFGDYPVELSAGYGTRDLTPVPKPTAPVPTPSVAPSTSAAPSVAPSSSAAPSVAPSSSAAPSVAPSTSAAPSVAPSSSAAPSVAPSSSAAPSASAPPAQSAWIRVVISVLDTADISTSEGEVLDAILASLELYGPRESVFGPFTVAGGERMYVLLNLASYQGDSTSSIMDAAEEAALTGAVASAISGAGLSGEGVSVELAASYGTLPSKCDQDWEVPSVTGSCVAEVDVISHFALARIVVVAEVSAAQLIESVSLLQKAMPKISTLASLVSLDNATFANADDQLVGRVAMGFDLLAQGLLLGGYDEEDDFLNAVMSKLQQLLAFAVPSAQVVFVIEVEFPSDNNQQACSGLSVLAADGSCMLWACDTAQQLLVSGKQPQCAAWSYPTLAFAHAVVTAPDAAFDTSSSDLAGALETALADHGAAVSVIGPLEIASQSGTSKLYMALNFDTWDPATPGYPMGMAESQVLTSVVMNAVSSVLPSLDSSAVAWSVGYGKLSACPDGQFPGASPNDACIDVEESSRGFITIVLEEINSQADAQVQAAVTAAAAAGFFVEGPTSQTFLLDTYVSRTRTHVLLRPQMTVYTALGVQGLDDVIAQSPVVQAFTDLSAATVVVQPTGALTRDTRCDALASPININGDSICMPWACAADDEMMSQTDAGYPVCVTYSEPAVLVAPIILEVDGTNARTATLAVDTGSITPASIDWAVDGVSASGDTFDVAIPAGFAGLRDATVTVSFGTISVNASTFVSVISAALSNSSPSSCVIAASACAVAVDVTGAPTAAEASVTYLLTRDVSGVKQVVTLEQGALRSGSGVWASERGVPASAAAGTYEVVVVIVVAIGQESLALSVNTTGLSVEVAAATSWVVGDYTGACVANNDCGVGLEYRPVHCEHATDGTVADAQCVGEKPTSSRPCFAGPCGSDSVAVFTGPWGTCSQSCGGGVQQRSVECRDASGAVVADQDCVDALGKSMPASQRACNTAACEVFAVEYSEWRECTEPCGGGKQYRDATCLGSRGSIGSAAQCAGDAEPTERSCNEQACPTFYYRVGEWGACSKACRDEFGPGETSRVATCFNGLTGSPAAGGAAECDAAGVQAPAVSKVCNSRPCTVYSLAISEWSDCSVACGGVRTRSATCQGTSSGVTRELDLAACMALGMTVPLLEEVCNDCTHCEQGLPPSQECSGNGACDNTGVCVCDAGYSGLICEASAACPAGQVLDATGSCCAGLLNENQECCDSIDASGDCCNLPNVVDACGVCGGDGVVVDAVGTCCATVLDADGLCCESGKLDSLRTCDGVDGGRQSAGVGSAIPSSFTGYTSESAEDPTDVRTLQYKAEMRAHAANKLGRPLDKVNVGEISVTLARQLRSGRSLAGSMDVTVNLDPTGTGSNFVERNILSLVLS
jgi:hypothetical protein